MDIENQKDEAASVSVPTNSVNMDIGAKKHEAASVSVLKPVENLKVDEVKDVKFKKERKSVPVLEAIKQPSSDDSTESLHAFQLRRRKKKKHNENLQKQMITHFFKPVKKVQIKQEKLDKHFEEEPKKVQGNGSVITLKAQIHEPPKDIKPDKSRCDASTATSDNFSPPNVNNKSSDVSKPAQQKPKEPIVFKREVIDLTYDDACFNEMSTQTEEWPAEDTREPSAEPSNDKDTSSSNSIHLSSGSATSFNTTSDSLNCTDKMSSLNLQEVDLKKNEVEMNLGEVEVASDSIEKDVNAVDNDDSSMSCSDNKAGSYSKFVEHMSPPSKLPTSSPHRKTDDRVILDSSPPLKAVLNETRDELIQVKMMLSNFIPPTPLKRSGEESVEVPKKKQKTSGGEVKSYSMRSRPSSRASSTVQSESEILDEDALLNYAEGSDGIPIEEDEDNGDDGELFNESILMGDSEGEKNIGGTSQTSPPPLKGSRRISPPPIVRPKSSSESEPEMWDSDMAAESNEDDMEGYGKNDQIEFEVDGQGENTYDAGYLVEDPAQVTEAIPQNPSVKNGKTKQQESTSATTVKQRSGNNGKNTAGNAHRMTGQKSVFSTSSQAVHLASGSTNKSGTKEPKTGNKSSQRVGKTPSKPCTETSQAHVKPNVKNTSKQNQPTTHVQQAAPVTVPVTAPVTAPVTTPVTAPSDVQGAPPTTLSLIPITRNEDGSVKKMTVDSNNIATHPFFYGTLWVNFFLLPRTEMKMYVIVQNNPMSF